MDHASSKGTHDKHALIMAVQNHLLTDESVATWLFDGDNGRYSTHKVAFS
jgi:hypothetical protein